MQSFVYLLQDLGVIPNKWSEESKKNFKKPKSAEHNRKNSEAKKLWWVNKKAAG